MLRRKCLCGVMIYSVKEKQRCISTLLRGMVVSNDNKKEQYYKCSKCGVVKRLSDMTDREKSLLY